MLIFNGVLIDTQLQAERYRFTIWFDIGIVAINARRNFPILGLFYFLCNKFSRKVVGFQKKITNFAAVLIRFY